ncbi:hypothetical protein [Hymenobacter sp. B81]|uniref:hypothetical protein n=1 Tax=Hymenobacter sp. B81 TaxID=3344878 RepID=UPI0037DD11FE
MSVLVIAALAVMLLGAVLWAVRWMRWSPVALFPLVVLTSFWWLSWAGIMPVAFFVWHLSKKAAA